MPSTNVKIEDLIRGLPVTAAHGAGVDAVRDITEDSRSATKGCLFVARSGTKADGKRFVADAVGRGAVAVLAESAADVPPQTVALVCEDVPTVSARMAERFFGNPTSNLKLIGITGTNGKTTSSYLIRHLLNNAGIRCGLIGTVQTDDGRTVAPAELTTPPAIELSRLLAAMVKNGCGAAVMEASSHALHQKRTAGLDFHIAVFTNLTGDHLDYHRTMEAYLNAKSILFEGRGSDDFAILNIDDPASAQLVRRTFAQVVSCSMLDQQAACFASMGNQSLNSIEVVFSGPWGKIEGDLPLIGRHNVMNALQSLAVGHAMGLEHETLKTGILNCKAPPGRLEPVTSVHDDIAVLVDYAHTDDALENVLRSLRPILHASGTKGRLKVVFGCGGDRDRTKRPRMASVACKYADDVIVTSDNPRTEDPQAILDEIRTGLPHERLGSTLCMVDRAEAINAAIDGTDEGDIVLIAGKGHEDYQIIGTTKRPFDDRKVAAAALARRKTKVGLA